MRDLTLALNQWRLAKWIEISALWNQWFVDAKPTLTNKLQVDGTYCAFIGSEFPLTCFEGMFAEWLVFGLPGLQGTNAVGGRHLKRKMWHSVNTLRPRQNGRHFLDDIFKWIFLNENASISIDISLKFVPNGPINNIPALVKIMAWRRPGDKPLSEPMVVRLPMHICVTRPQWVNLDLHEF